MLIFKYCRRCFAGPFISRAEKNLHKAEHHAHDDPLCRHARELKDLQSRVTVVECKLGITK